MSLGLKAVSLGILIESVGFYAWFVLLMVVDVLSHYVSKDADAVVRRLHADPRFPAAMALVQVALIFLGGLVAGRVARRKEVAHGLVVGAAGVVVVWVNYPSLPWWGLVEMSLAVPTAIGGALAARASASQDVSTV